jgi:hypothetical protein
MMMPPATAEEIEEILGDIDTFTLEHVLDTRASVDEIAEALADFEDEQRFGERREPTTARAAEVREILEELAGEGVEEAYAS